MMSANLTSPLALQSVRLPTSVTKPRAASQSLSRARVVCGSLKEEVTPKNKAVKWLATGAATVAVSLSVGLAPATALFNTGEAITNPQDALAAVIATKKSVEALKIEVKEMSKDCPAPTFSCDMSQLLKKSSGRVSGPLQSALPALIEELGADPYAADDIKAAMLQAEAIMKSNNARVRVDWEGPVEMMNLATGSLNQLLQDLEPADLKAAEDRVAACDETIDPRLPGPFECRLVRAVYAKALAPGIN